MRSAELAFLPGSPPPLGCGNGFSALGVEAVEPPLALPLLQTGSGEHSFQCLKDCILRLLNPIDELGQLFMSEEVGVAGHCSCFYF